MSAKLYFVKAKTKNGYNDDQAYYHVCYTHEDAYEVYLALKSSKKYKYVFIHRVI